MATKPKNIKDYIIGFPKETQKALKQVHAAIKKAVPPVEETISYGIPAFKLNGRNLIYFAGYKNHIGLYPAPRQSETFKAELSKYKGGKGTVQFPLSKPIPLSLIVRILKFKAKESVVKTEAKKTTSKNYIKYHNDGTLWAKGKMMGEVQTGYWEWFRKGGTILRSGYFKDGKQTGEWTTYDKKGKVYKVTQIKD